MSDTPTQTPAVSEPIASIAERVSMPFLLFSGTLFVMLMFSWFFLVPRFTAMQVAGSSLTPAEVQSYVHRLQADVTTMEQKRDRLVLPLQDKEYARLKLARQSLPDLAEIRDMLRDAAARTDAPSAVTLTKISFDSETRTVVVTGDVAQVGPRSMTVLAAYVDAVGQLSFVQHLERPAFTRVDDGHGNSHSPFTFTITLTQPQ